MVSSSLGLVAPSDAVGGLHYVLCSKLRGFSYEKIEFFLSQLSHLIILIDNETMALEEFLVYLCEESVNGALLVCGRRRRTIYSKH